MSFEFRLFNENLIKSECQQADERYTFCCEIFTHVKQKITPPGNHSDVSSDAINCLNELSSHFEELFDMSIQSPIQCVAQKPIPSKFLFTTK